MAEQQDIIIKVHMDTGEVQAQVDGIKNAVNGIGNNGAPVEVFKSMKLQLREATNEAQKLGAQFGLNSAEFAKAAQKAATLRDKIEDANIAIKGFNPDNKLQGVVAIASGAVLAIQGVAGAFTLLGVKSEDSAKIIARLQGLMALSGALGSVDMIKDAYTGLKGAIQSSTIFMGIMTAATRTAAIVQFAFTGAVESTGLAFKMLRIAIASTGIGLLVIAIAAAVKLLIDFYAATQKAKEVQLELAKVLEEQVDAAYKKRFETLKKISDLQGKLGKETEIEAIERNKRLLEDEKKLNDNVLRSAKSKADRLNLITGDLDDKQKNEKDRAEKDLKEYGDRNRAIEAELSTTQLQTKVATQKQLEDITKAGFDSRVKQIERFTAVEVAAARERGATEAEIFKIEQNSRQLKLTEQQRYYATVSSRDKEAKASALANLKDSENDITLSQIKFNEEQKKRYKESYDILVKLNREKILNQQKDEIDAKKFKNKFDYEDQITEINKLQVDEAVKANLRRKAKGAYDSADQRLQDERNDIIDKKEVERQDKQIADLNKKQPALKMNSVEDTIKFLQSVFDLSVAYGKKEYGAEKDLYDNKRRLEREGLVASKASIAELAAFDNETRATGLELTKKDSDSKLDIIRFALQVGIEMAGRNTVVGKSLAIASATMDTYVGANKAFAEGGIFGFISGAAVIAAGLINVKKIIDTHVPEVPGSSISGGVSSPSLPSAAPTLNTTLLQQQATQNVRVTNQGQTAVRAYITNTDLTTNSDKQNFLNKLSSF